MSETVQALASVAWWLIVFGGTLAVVVAGTAIVWHVWDWIGDRDTQRRMQRLLEREQSRLVVKCLQSPMLDELDEIWRLDAREPQR